MCTATWLMADNGYELFCNRDERRTRRPALPPQLQQRAGVRFIAPRDADAGGSWIAVNEFGLSLCLLNHYPEAVASAVPSRNVSRASAVDSGRYTSRGLLLTSLTGHTAPVEVARTLWSMDLRCYKPFLLLILSRQSMPLLLKWDGRNISGDVRPQMPVTTSSFDTAHVIRARQERFAQLRQLDAPTLRRYHLTAGNADAVCMSRPDAHTVSFSHIRVTTDLIEFEYEPMEAALLPQLAPERLATKLPLLQLAS
jgi:hypothetical protein